MFGAASTIYNYFIEPGQIEYTWIFLSFLFEANPLQAAVIIWPWVDPELTGSELTCHEFVEVNIAG